MTREYFHLDAIIAGEDAPPHIPFAAYMDAAMFDPRFGYYGSGRVRFGDHAQDDYWTFPVRLSPWFGKLLARRVLDLWRALPSPAGGAPFCLVEVGGGLGHLMIDTVGGLHDHAAAGDPDARALLAELQVFAVDRSPALLGRQVEAQGGLAVTYVNAAADQLHTVLPRPFRGLIFANELLTQMSVDVMHVSAGGARTLSVLPWLAEPLHDLTEPGSSATHRPLTPGKLPELMGRLAADEALRRRFAAREIVRWTGTLGAPSAEVERYLAFSRPAIQRLMRATGPSRLPIWVTHLGPLPAVVGALAELLREGQGAFLTVDYGGTLHHVFDAGSKLPHLRTFSADEEGEGAHDPFRAPGAEDMTTDLDFSWLVHLAEGAGLELGYYGHQAALETGADLWADKAIQKALIDGRIAEGYPPMQAGLEAWRMIKELRGAGGFRLIALTSPGLAQAFAGLGPSDPVRVETLPEVPPGLTLGALMEALARHLPEDAPPELVASIADALRPHGSVVDDLADAGHYAYRQAVMAALRSAAAPVSSEHVRPARVSVVT